MSFLLSFKIYMIKLNYEVIKMKLKYLSLLLSSICIMQFVAVPSLTNAQAMEIKSNLAIDVENIKDTAEYKGYLWRIDAKDDDNLPRNFRTSKDKFKKVSDKYGIDVNYVPTREGLDELQASGSAQFSLNQFSALTKALQENGAKDIYIVDLRQENHGFFNNDAVSWYGKRDWANIGKSRKEIIRQEMNLLKANLNKDTKRATLDDDKNADEVDTSLIKTVTTEKNLVKKNNLHYVRITATDHVWPSPENIDEFIKLYKSLPKDAWLHFHCEAGKGRTTTFLAMYDMMKNPQVPLKDILYRQLLLGGNYVAYTEDISASSNWKAPYYNQKAKMIEVFYRYVQENHQNNFQVLWSDWLKNHSL